MKKKNQTLAKIIVVGLIVAVVVTYSVSFAVYLF
ncbi:unknown [Firmicutes bacterium CAG:145]|nr:unknown [Firmicutes bacterium CAG:145]